MKAKSEAGEIESYQTAMLAATLGDLRQTPLQLHTLQAPWRSG